MKENRLLREQIAKLTTENEAILKTNKCLTEENDSLKESVNNQKRALDAERRDHNLVMDAVKEQLRNYESKIESLKRGTDDVKLEIVSRIQSLGSMPIISLRGIPSDFDVYPASEIHDEDENANENDSRWVVVTSYCSRCGCDFRAFFDDERSARIYAIIRTKAKIPAGKQICLVCQREAQRELE